MIVYQITYTIRDRYHWYKNPLNLKTRIKNLSSQYNVHLIMKLNFRSITDNQRLLMLSYNLYLTYFPLDESTTKSLNFSTIVRRGHRYGGVTRMMLLNII